jgi:hypothetical protein
MKYGYGAKVKNPSLYHLTCLRSNPGTRSKRSATGRVSHGTSSSSNVPHLYSGGVRFETGRVNVSTTLTDVLVVFFSLHTSVVALP